MNNDPRQRRQQRAYERRRQRLGNYYNKRANANNSETPSDDESTSEEESVQEENQKKSGLSTAIKKKMMTSAGMSNKDASSMAQNLSFGDTIKGIIKMLPLKVKIIIYVVIFAFAAIALAIVVVLFGSELSSSGISGGGGDVGSYFYGGNCTSVKVKNTGCDGSANNCTLEYDGTVALEDYIAGVVAAEVGSVNNLEYYKTAAIAARTYLFTHMGSDCTVEGNARFQAYMDVNDNTYAVTIKQAVNETDGIVLTKEDRLVAANYASACVVNADEDYYYVRYGSKSYDKPRIQKIPKEWDSTAPAFKGYLENWYSKTDKNNTDYLNKKCPSNHDYGMSQIGALYLIVEENYTYQQVISYYFGENINLAENQMLLGGAEGFTNPTRYINCSSPFGYRSHPISGKQELHTGIDIAISGGEPIYAAQDGVVRKVVNNVSGINMCAYGYGNYIIIDHADGLATLYAHMKYGSIPSSIKAGSQVFQGQQIGAVGSTGCSTGNHLHYEVRLNNKYINPADYLDLSSATGRCNR